MGKPCLSTFPGSETGLFGLPGFRDKLGNDLQDLAGRMRCIRQTFHKVYRPYHLDIFEIRRNCLSAILPLNLGLLLSNGLVNYISNRRVVGFEKSLRLFLHPRLVLCLADLALCRDIVHFNPMFRLAEPLRMKNLVRPFTPPEAVPTTNLNTFTLGYRITLTKKCRKKAYYTRTL